MIARTALLALSLLFLTPIASAETQREMFQTAKIKEGDARRTVMGLVPKHSVVQSIELEREGGKLVWSYDIKTPGTKSITEIQIDALTGDVASRHEESPQAEAAEQAAEKH